MERIPNITGLRFFLAFLVIIFHVSEFCHKHEIPFYDALPVFHKGYEAVCVFFSLSGFLIIRQLYIEKNLLNTISLKNFYTRRILRIFPLYFLILFFGLTYYNYILPKLGFAGGYNTDYNLWEGIALSVFFMPNVFASLYSPGGIIEILWSIGVEEQFYLFIAPILLWTPIKKHLPVLLGLTIAFFVVYFCIENSFFLRFNMLFFYFTSSGFVSILFLRYPSFFRNKIVAYLLFLTFVLYFTTTIFNDFFSEANYNLVSMLLFSMVIGMLSLQQNCFLNHPIVTYLGKISYGIYMYHAIVIQFFGLIYLKIFAEMGINYYLIVVVFNLTVIAVTIGVSHLSYRYFEKFFMSLYPKDSLHKNLL